MNKSGMARCFVSGMRSGKRYVAVYGGKPQSLCGMSIVDVFMNKYQTVQEPPVKINDGSSIYLTGFDMGKSPFVSQHDLKMIDDMRDSEEYKQFREKMLGKWGKPITTESMNPVKEDDCHDAFRYALEALESERNAEKWSKEARVAYSGRTMLEPHKPRKIDYMG
ncbi:MAG: hypothetical protein ACQ5SW_08350 [Sphaerochaetaceae bacterium]